MRSGVARLTLCVSHSLMPFACPHPPTCLRAAGPAPRPRALRPGVGPAGVCVCVCVQAKSHWQIPGETQCLTEVGMGQSPLCTPFTPSPGALLTQRPQPWGCPKWPAPHCVPIPRGQDRGDPSLASLPCTPCPHSPPGCFGSRSASLAPVISSVSWRPEVV